MQRGGPGGPGATWRAFGPRKHGTARSLLWYQCTVAPVFGDHLARLTRAPAHAGGRG